MSSLSQMQAAVNEQERINSQLRRELAALESGIANAQHKWSELTGRINGTLQNGHNRMVNSHQRTLQAYELQLEIEEMFKLYKCKELANKKIRACKNKVYYDFANYNAVRKIVRAILDNIEHNFVSTAALTKAVEVKHLQLPDFWLTCALLSLMAWQNDDRELAERSLARACKLDKKNTCIFFFAFYLRMGRETTALKWFAEYIACARTGEDQTNILLMFAIANNTLQQECGDEVLSKINAFIDRLIKEDLARTGYSEDEIVERIRMYHKAFKTVDAVDYPLLSKYCTDMSFLTTQLANAKTNVKLLDFIVNTVNVTAKEKTTFLNSFIEDVIDRANTVEKDVVNEIKYNELIIENDGHTDIAKEQYDEWLKHQETEFEMIAEMVNWVYRADDEEVSPAAKRMMFVLTKNLIKTAIDRDVTAYRNAHRHTLAIKIGEYESTADLSKSDSENSKIEQYFRDKAAALAAQEKMWPCFVWFGVGALATVGTIALAQPALLVGTAAGIIGGVAKILLTNKRKKNIFAQSEIDANNTKSVFSQVAAEYAKYNEDYLAYDRYYEEIEAEFAKI